MPTFKVLKTAIQNRRCVMLVAQHWRRTLCPHAIGYKNNQLKVLAYQYGGGSASGLPKAGGWRTFVVDEILRAEIIEGPWRTSDDYLVKLETTFDRVEHRVRPGKSG